MAAQNTVMESVTYDGHRAGFAKLQGEDFCYYMINYSIICGRNIEGSEVDLDLSSFGGKNKRVSHQHARIFYDFENRHFSLEVLGRNGCMVQGVDYRPGCDPVKLNSQDLIDIVGIKMYFLLPTRSIFDTIAAERSTPLQVKHSTVMPPNHRRHGKSKRKNKKSSGGGESNISNSSATTGADPIGALSDTHGNSEHNKNNQQLLPQEKDVVLSILNIMCSVFESGECVPMKKLHSKLVQIWSQDCILKYLTPEEGSSNETECRPWTKLLELLKKHPEHFVIYTKTRGEETSESVALVSP